MRRVLRCSVVLIASLIMTGVAAGAPLPVTPQLNLQATPLLRKIVNSALSNLITMGEVERQTFGAARNQLVTLDQEGNITRSVSIPIEQPAGISAYTTGKAIIGDSGSNSVFSVDIRSGQSAKVLDLRTTDYGNFVAGDVVRSGRLSSVAFDGKYVYVAMSAGYSSSISPWIRRRIGRSCRHGRRATSLRQCSSPVETSTFWIPRAVSCGCSILHSG